jgi:hypothetical protein
MNLMGHSTVTDSRSLTDPQRYVHPSPESVDLAVERMAALQLKKVNAVGILSGILAASSQSSLQ